MVKAIKMLRIICQRSLAQKPLTPKQAQWLGEGLSAFLERRCRTLQEALDIPALQGGIPWWKQEAIACRNVLLRQLAHRFFADQSTRHQAQMIHRIAVRYAASTWRFDQERSAMPTHYANTPKSLLWRAFKSGAAMPVCERHLRSILSQPSLGPRALGPTREASVWTNKKEGARSKGGVNL